ncbi:MAG: AMP-binding protein, partial [Acidimicrobiales bacterium]
MAATMRSTMQTGALTTTVLLRHGMQVHRRSQVLGYDGLKVRATSFAEVGERCVALAAGLRRLGVGPGDIVATLMWNTPEHLECYLAVPSMGAALHTANLRLPAADLAETLSRSGARVLLFHTSISGLVSELEGRLPGVEHIVAVDDCVGDGPLWSGLEYEALLA